MPLILVTNDDGVHSEGLRALYDAVKGLGETFVVAPDRERSAAAHSLTIHKPLKVQEIRDRTFSVTGTPTDCVAVGVEKILPRRPDLVLSGINHGPNLGDDLTYSGTVSAALEGTIMTIPSLAVSLAVENGAEPHFETAAHISARVAEYVLEHSLPFDTLLNVNVPNIRTEELKGIRFTRQGKRIYEGSIQETFSPWGEKFFWIGGGTPRWEHGEDTDITAVMEGYVSITPLHPDFTNYKAIEFLKSRPGPWNTKS
jgi:5'-nucleotidase